MAEPTNEHSQPIGDTQAQNRGEGDASVSPGTNAKARASEAAGPVARKGAGANASSPEPIDTISGVTKELFEARSASTPEGKKKEALIGVAAAVIAIIAIALFMLLTR